MKIYICGDSTAASYDPEKTRMVGWGQLLGNYLPECRIENLAMAGRSTRTFLAENRLQPAADGGCPGDLLLVQFAHNDENEQKPERYCEARGAYRQNLLAFIRFARQRGMRPVLLTPICMRIWQNGTLQPTHGEYPAVMRETAREERVPLIDLYGESFRIVSEMGEEASCRLFLRVLPGEDPGCPEGFQDNAHTVRAGADLFAAFAARELRTVIRTGPAGSGAVLRRR